MSKIGPSLVEMGNKAELELDSGNFVRNGYMTFTMVIANLLDDIYTEEFLDEDMADSDKIVLLYIDKEVKGWNEFINGEIKNINEKNKKVLG